MLLQKKVVLALIQARLKALDRIPTDPEVAAGLTNEFTALTAALEDLPGMALAEGQALQKADPLDTAIDMVALRIRQIMDGNEPSRFVQVQRLGKLAQMIRREAGNRVEDFIDDCDPEGGAIMGGYGAVGRFRANPARIGAPYGMGENPAGPMPRQYDVNDLYREVIEAIRPMLDQRAEEGKANMRRDRAAELRHLLQARKELGEADTSKLDARIEALTDELGDGADEGAPVDPDDLPRPPERRGEDRPWTAVEHRNVEPTGVPGLQMRDPDCEHCNEFPPIVIRNRRVHVVGDETVDCRTPIPTEDAEATA